MVKPGVGGNWQAIAKATSCQDNAWGHRCPPIPTLMLIAFQCLWDNLSNNCFSCVNSGLRAANKRDGTLFLTITAKPLHCIQSSLYPLCLFTHVKNPQMLVPCYGYKIMPGRHLLQADFKVCRGGCVIGRPLLNIRPVFFEKRCGSCNQSPVFKKSKRQIFSFTYLKQPFHPLL